ncbi:MAG: hypothetical protein AB1813_13235 [Verrucomicrobiota bacterium]
MKKARFHRPGNSAGLFQVLLEGPRATRPSVVLSSGYLPRLGSATPPLTLRFLTQGSLRSPGKRTTRSAF